ncbi:hypothetical protein CVT25_008124 [Psilocybe cyanescens]|uniref:Uncharacterized protein n=1 Tax=Psilocybe cyanescens TaxID=93625 RepID=A0A409X9F8_PSICY|nr:hypothetical protein CVT25_008124 [Psilocybe cyanescens]
MRGGDGDEDGEGVACGVVLGGKEEQQQGEGVILGWAGAGLACHWYWGWSSSMLKATQTASAAKHAPIAKEDCGLADFGAAEPYPASMSLPD